MVECSVTPGLLGAMTLHILNPPPAVQYTEAAPVPVQLRIATGNFIVWCYFFFTLCLLCGLNTNVFL